MHPNRTQSIPLLYCHVFYQEKSCCGEAYFDVHVLLFRRYVRRCTLKTFLVTSNDEIATSVHLEGPFPSCPQDSVPTIAELIEDTAALILAMNSSH